MKTYFMSIVLFLTGCSSVSQAWYIDHIGCKQDLYPNDPTKSTYLTVKWDKVDRSTYAKSDTFPPPQIQDEYTYDAHYASNRKINESTAWVGVFYWVNIYDGFDLNDGQLTDAQGNSFQSRVEVRFEPYSDKAYGPDYANVVIFVKLPGDYAWRVYQEEKHCHVSVYH